MATFSDPDGNTIIIRNHECEELAPKIGAFGKQLELLAKVESRFLYDGGSKNVPVMGGTTTLVFDTRRQKLVRHYLSLAGTLRNCAGGPTPWNSWLTCEETEQLAGGPFLKDHGYVFEVPARSEIGLVEPIPLTAMGRFRHEAVAVDAKSGVIYETEDMDDGLIYRFLPERQQDLKRGGKLQALALIGRPAVDLRNWKSNSPVIAVGESVPVEWIDLEDIQSPANDLRQRGHSAGAARFARGEGMWYGNEGVYFACTTGGHARLGQIWRYRPSPHEGQPEEARSPGRLELFVEPNDGRLVENADNLTVAPWGDLVICEDGLSDQHVIGVTPKGKFYRLARNAVSQSEFAGATFSPDGSTLFVNIQHDGLTVAITGPWRSRA
jgi:hypothetical protein